MAQNLNIDPSVHHKCFDEHQKVVQTTYDVFYSRVRNERHLSRLKGQDDAQYEAYACRAPFLNATERAVQQLIGTMMRNPMEVQGADPSEIVCDDSHSLDAFVQDLIMDTALGGRVLIGVDFDDEEDMVQPYMDYYPSENVINWCDEFIMLEVEEDIPNPKNPYEMIPTTRWKELFIASEDTQPPVDPSLYGTYCARYWDKVGRKFTVSDPVQGLINGSPVNFIPYFWANAYDNTDILYSPMLSTLAGLNSAHFRLSADHYHGLHYLAVPTFTISGELYRDQNGNQDSNIVLGSTTKALHLEKDGKASFTEFSGSGLNSILEEKARLEVQMEEAGSKLLTTATPNETATAANLRAGGETATLETLTNALETALNKALELYGYAIGKTVTVILNKNFTDTIGQESPAAPDTMGSVLVLNDKGVISNEDTLREAQRRGIVSNGVTPAEKLLLANQVQGT